MSSTSDPHARTFFASRTVGVHSCAHCNRLVLTPRKFTAVTPPADDARTLTDRSRSMLSTTTRTQEPLRDDVLHQCASPGALQHVSASTAVRYHSRLTHRSQQSYSACRQQHGQAASCAPWPGVRAASASGAMLAQMVKSATSYAVVVPRARLRPHAFPIPRARSINVSQPAAAPAGRADVERGAA